MGSQSGGPKKGRERKEARGGKTEKARPIAYIKGENKSLKKNTNGYKTIVLEKLNLLILTLVFCNAKLTH